MTVYILDNDAAVVVRSLSCSAVERLVVSVAANFKQEMTGYLPLHVLQV